MKLTIKEIQERIASARKGNFECVYVLIGNKFRIRVLNDYLNNARELTKIQLKALNGMVIERELVEE